MILRWLGTASVMIDDGERIIVTDPFPGIPPDKKAEEYMKRAEHVLVSHGHFDHICAIKDLYKDTDVKVYCTKTPKATLISNGLDENKIKTIAPNDSFEIGNFKIDVYQGRHGKFDFPTVVSCLLRSVIHPIKIIKILKLHLSFAEKGETVFYELKHKSFRLQIIGSPGLDKDTDYPTGADALILAFQGRSDLEDTVIPFIKRLAPKRVYLDHFDNTFFPMSKNVNTSGIVKRVVEELGIPCKAFEKYESVSF